MTINGTVPSIGCFCFIDTIARRDRGKTTTICNGYPRTHVLVIDEDDKVDTDSGTSVGDLSNTINALLRFNADDTRYNEVFQGGMNCSPRRISL